MQPQLLMTSQTPSPQKVIPCGYIPENGVVVALTESSFLGAAVLAAFSPLLHKQIICAHIPGRVLESISAVRPNYREERDKGQVSRQGTVLEGFRKRPAY